MNVAKAVFEICPSTEDDRPQIDFERPSHMAVNWGLVGDVIDRRVAASEYIPIYLVVPEPGATTWDLYSVPGTLGLFSAKTVQSLGRAALCMFKPLPGYINESEYFFLRPDQKLDCFDRAKAEFVPFRNDPSRIMQVRRYAFNLDRISDPLVFCMPDPRGGLFATKSVERAIRQSNLKGIVCKLVS